MRQQKKDKKKAAQRQVPKRFSFNALNDFIAELRKTVWPSREEAVRLSIMVIAVSVAVGILLGALDYGFAQLARLFLP